MTPDFFISHASEDKEAIARPLAHELEGRGYNVWFDESSLKPGDSLRRSIEHGISAARLAIVILSPRYFAKEWTQRELDALTTEEVRRKSPLIVPVWHEVTHEEVARFSPVLADKYALSTAKGLPDVAEHLSRLILPSKSRSRQPTVLLVDDDLPFRSLLADALTMAGYGICELRDGTLVRDVALGLRPDLIMLDLAMPNRSGREALDDLKTLQATRNIPVLMMSAHPTSEMRSPMHDPDGAIQKPFDLLVLLDTVASLMGRSPERD